MMYCMHYFRNKMTYTVTLTLEIYEKYVLENVLEFDVSLCVETLV